MKNEVPILDKRLTYGAISSYHIQNDISYERGKYHFYIYLTFLNHDKQIRIQRGGFNRRSEALKAKEIVINQLYNNEFIPWDFNARDFYDYWLYHVRTDLKYNSFMGYRNIIYNYLLPDIGNRKLSQLDYKRLLVVARRMKERKASYKLLKSVLFSSFSYMRTNNLINNNPVPIVFRIIDGQEKNCINNESLNLSIQKPQKKYKVLSADQAAYLLYSCKQYDFSRYIYAAII